MFDNFHPTHPDRDYNLPSETEVENAPSEYHYPLEETSNVQEHHLADNLEDEDPYHGTAVEHVIPEEKPIKPVVQPVLPVVPAVLPEAPAVPAVGMYPK